MGNRKVGAQRKTTAKGETAAPQQTEQRTFTPIPDGWYDLTIVDINPEYRAQNSAAMFVVFKLRISGSMRYKDRTLSLFISESMTGEAQGKKFASQRAQILERFHIDPWKDADKFLDMHVRGHVTVEQGREGKLYNRVPSIYPNDWRGENNSATTEDDELEQEIPF